MNHSKFNLLVQRLLEEIFGLDKWLCTTGVLVCRIVVCKCDGRVPTPVGISGKRQELSSVIPDREIVPNSIYFVLNSGKCVRRNFSLN